MISNIFRVALVFSITLGSFSLEALETDYINQGYTLLSASVSEYVFEKEDGTQKSIKSQAAFNIQSSQDCKDYVDTQEDYEGFLYLSEPQEVQSLSGWAFGVKYDVEEMGRIKYQVVHLCYAKRNS